MNDLTPPQAGAAQLEQLWRAHWTIENRSQYVRDITLGEDRGQAHTGSTAHALAAWRNGIVGLLRQAGWQNIADAVRVCGLGTCRAPLGGGYSAWTLT